MKITTRPDSLEAAGIPHDQMLQILGGTDEIYRLRQENATMRSWQIRSSLLSFPVLLP
jgi:hypothetical protein